jgi:1-acyl-sn-glycerol-3-phosphate acyltransferase
VAALCGPAVFAANHMSMLDTLILPPFILAFRPVSMVVKSSLLRYPMFGRVLRQIQPISVERANPREDLETVLREGVRLLSTGRSVCLFPQATRSTVFRVADFNSLGAKLARRAGTPLVPIALQTDFQQLGRIARDMGPLDRARPVRIAFGPACDVTGNGREAHRHVVGFIVETFRRWNVTIIQEETT